ncbi:MAG: hypothetical protein U0R64_04280 [Candidatus Nanopelagicales bacterium]
MRGVVAVVLVGIMVSSPAGADTPDPAVDLRHQMIEAVASAPGFTVTVAEGPASEAVVKVGHQGSVGLLNEAGTGQVQFVGTRKVIFLKGGPAFRRSLGRADARVLGRRWLALPTGDPKGLGYGGKFDGSAPAARAFAGLVSLRRVIAEMLNPQLAPVSLGERVVSGVALQGIQVGDAQVWATVETPLRIVSFTSLGAAGLVTDWGQEPAVTPPRRSVPVRKLPSHRVHRDHRGSHRHRRHQHYRDRGVQVGVGANGVTVGDPARRVRRLLGRPDSLEIGRNTFGAFRMWHYSQRFHVDLRDGRVVGVSVQSRRMRTAQGIGVGSTVAQVQRAYDPVCAQVAHDGDVCTLGDLLPGAVVTTLRASPGSRRISEVTVVRITD